MTLPTSTALILPTLAALILPTLTDLILPTLTDLIFADSDGHDFAGFDSLDGDFTNYSLGYGIHINWVNITQHPLLGV